MEIYNEQMERIENPDLELGWLEDTVRIIRHEAIEGVEDIWHYETAAEYPNGGRDVVRVIDIPGVEAKDAWDEEIPIQIYHPYTQEELAQRENGEEKPSFESRLAALEEENQHLKEALDLLLSGTVEEASADA